MPVDLTPTAHLVADLVRGVPDDALAQPTPCPAYRVADLLDHLGGLSLAFRAAAEKQPLDGRPGTAGAALDEDWRQDIPEAVLALAAAWEDPDAWTGMTAAGGIDLPGEIAGLIALDELVVHGWDLARAIGAPYQPDEASLEAVHAFLAPATEPSDPGDPGDPGDSGDGADEQGSELFGPPVPVPASAPLLDRTIGLTGRDPGWTAR